MPERLKRAISKRESIRPFGLLQFCENTLMVQFDKNRRNKPDVHSLTG